MAEQLNDILNRIAALEVATAPPPQIDLSDPPLYLHDQNGVAVNPDTIEKVPDLVKDLPIFSGDPSELNVWLRDAEDLIVMYTPSVTSTLAQKNKFHVVCKTIRRKIRGEANDALVASNVNINWKLIKKTLITYYGDKRDLGTLDHQLSSCHQRGRSLEEFYNDVNKILSLISNCIGTDPHFSHPEATRSLISLYNKKAIDAFIRGLDGEVGRFLKNANVDSLANAYSYCITFQNMEYRKSATRPKSYEFTNGPRNQIPNAPRLFPKPTKTPRFPMRPPPQIFIPSRHASFNPQPQPNFPKQQQSFPQQFSQQQQPKLFAPPKLPPKNPFQAPLDKPVPMDVDTSIRSRQIDYGNRPKKPRNFNIATNYYEDQYYEDENWDEYFQVPYEDENSSFDRYYKTIETQDDNEDHEESAELNFLG